jgi:signal-transduction protein with cAMP-binding, CBS, and nucleotidyltransferase domain
VISSEICSKTRRAAELAEERPRIAGASPPPVPYAVLVLDSVGRKESPLAADQDNATTQKADRRTPTSKQLATQMCDILDAGHCVPHWRRDGQE